MFVKLDAWSRDLNSCFTLNDCLFKSVKLAQNANPDTCIYNSCDIVFDLYYKFSFSDGSKSKTIFIWSWHELICAYDSKKADIVILDKVVTQVLDDTVLAAKAQYSISLSR